MAREMLHFIGMRPIPALFLIAAIGFVFILHKKDVPEATDSKMKTSRLHKVSKHNWMKRALDTSRSVAKTASKQRKENEVP
jgi:hypothetical protein